MYCRFEKKLVSGIRTSKVDESNVEPVEVTTMQYSSLVICRLNLSRSDEVRMISKIQGSQN